MSITKFHAAIWMQDFKILGKALSCYIHSKLSRMIRKIHNIETPFPLHRHEQKNTNTAPSLQPEHVYYGTGDDNNSVVLLSYIKLPVY